MRCEEARQLFDAYLDGELSPSLATELGVHRVRCAECRRSFALLEVSGHILSSDRDPVTVPDDFSERLLACVDVREHSWPAKVRRSLYFVGPLAAAAVIAMAFLGFFDRSRDSRVAGVKVEPTHVEAGAPRPNTPSAYDREAAERAIDQWIGQMQTSRAANSQTGKSIPKPSDLTILQLLEMLKDTDEGAPELQHFPGADLHELFGPPDEHPVDDEDVEDL
jgi:anti-sigma factor RsiW